jgi:hypothetical protein
MGGNMIDAKKPPDATDLSNAKKLLCQRGYAVIEKEGHLVVDDPVHQVDGRQLKLSGYKPVPIRNQSEAWAFLIQRD